MKAGTTSLYHYLQDHPQIALPNYKAPEFFVEESNWHRGIDWYRKQFASTEPEAVAIGEASNAYAKYPRFQGIPQRIAKYIPNVRLIYAVRDPIARLRSHYQTTFAQGTEKAPFDEAVFTNPIYLNYSRYALQIEQYLEYFSREQLLIITAEDLLNNRQATVRKVYEFLEVDAGFVPENLDREFYQTKERAARSPIPLWLRKGLKKHLPASKRFKELENNVFRKLNRFRQRKEKNSQKTNPFTISQAVREKLSRELEGDVRRLRAYIGEGFDGWGIG